MSNEIETCDLENKVINGDKGKHNEKDNKLTWGWYLENKNSVVNTREGTYWNSREKQ